MSMTLIYNANQVKSIERRLHEISYSIVAQRSLLRLIKGSRNLGKLRQKCFNEFHRNQIVLSAYLSVFNNAEFSNNCYSCKLMHSCFVLTSLLLSLHAQSEILTKAFPN